MNRPSLSMTSLCVSDIIIGRGCVQIRAILGHIL